MDSRQLWSTHGDYDKSVSFGVAIKSNILYARVISYHWDAMSYFGQFRVLFVRPSISVMKIKVVVGQCVMISATILSFFVS